jgi:hypothetical protein
MLQSPLYLLVYGSMPAATAADLPGILRRQPIATSHVLTTLFAVGDAAGKPAPPDLFAFSFPFYAPSDPNLGAELCCLLNRNYEMVERKGTVVRFEPWAGAPTTPAARRLIEKQLELIAGYGAAYANPITRVELLSGARRLGEYWWNARTLEKVLQAEAGDGGEGAVHDPSGASTVPAGNRRKHRQRKPRNLTAKQLEAMQVFGECECNYSEAARRLGLSLTAARDRIQAAYTKLGRQVPAKAQTQALPADRRGGAGVTPGPKPDARGDGKDRSGHDRRWC